MRIAMQDGDVRPTRLKWGRLLGFMLPLCLPQLLMIGSCATSSNPGERVTGDCKVLLFHCSSRQVTLAPEPGQQAAIARLGERNYPGLPITEAVTKSADALHRLGFSFLSAEPEYGLLQAERDKVLATDGQRRRRVLLPALISAAARGPVSVPFLKGPDHESMHALVVARSDAATRSTWVRIELNETIVDSKGNSRTTTPTDAETYDAFFRALNEARASEDAATSGQER
jgi:hypothetical protein